MVKTELNLEEEISPKSLSILRMVCSVYWIETATPIRQDWKQKMAIIVSLQYVIANCLDFE